MKSKNSKLLPVFKTCLLGLLVFSSLSAGASENVLDKRIQSQQTRANFGVNIEPLWLVLGGIGGKAEYFISDKISVGLGGMVIPKQLAKKTEQESESSADIGGNYKMEHSEVVLGSNLMLTGSLQTRGIYLNPGVGYQSTTISEYSTLDLKGSLASPFLRMTAGYQWITKQKIRFAAGGGATVLQEADVVIADNKGHEVYREKVSNGSGLALDLHIGYLF